MNTPIRQLENGSTPADPETVLAFLEEQGLAFSTRDHPPMFSVIDSQALRPPNVSGGYTKNLFLRNKKGATWFITCDENQSVDLRHLGAELGAGRFSFASPEQLMRFLGTTTVVVSLLGSLMMSHETFTSQSIGRCYAMINYMFIR